MRSLVVLLSIALAAGCGFDADLAIDPGSAPSPSPSPSPSPGPDGDSDDQPSPEIPTSGPGQLIAHLAATAPTVDDEDIDLAEWAGADPATFALDRNELVIDEGNYSPSAQVAMSALYDADFVYLWIQIDDGELYTADSIELFIDGANDGGAIDADDHYLILGPWRDETMELVHDESDLQLTGRFHTDVPGGSWSVELAIARSSLGADPTATLLGFDVGVLDVDAYGQGYGLWHLGTSTCVDCCVDVPTGPWCDSATSGTLLLW